MLKYLYILVIGVCCFSAFGQNSKMVLQGHYAGNNVYIQNPVKASGIGFCIDTVLVNDQEIAFDNSSAFEVTLDRMNLEKGDTVNIVIIHHTDCQPRVLREWSQVRPVEITSVEIDSNRVLRWTCTEQDRLACFKVEQYRWNKWNSIMDTCGGEGEYTFELSSDLEHSGVNEFRVRTQDPRTRRIDISAVKTIENEFPPVIYRYLAEAGKVNFSRKTWWQLYDEFGNMLKKGRSKEVDLKGCKKGLYYINYDNENTSFVIK